MRLCLLKKRLFFKIGLFDSTFIFNFEDVDLGLRMTCAGYRLLFDPHVKEMHKGSRTACNVISDRVLRLSVLNTHAMYLKIAPYSFWPYIILNHFQRSILRYEMSRLKQKKADAPSCSEGFFRYELSVHQSGKTGSDTPKCIKKVWSSGQAKTRRHGKWKTLLLQSVKKVFVSLFCFGGTAIALFHRKSK